MGNQSEKEKFAILTHEILNDVATVLGIAQLNLATKEMSPQLRAEFQRIVKVGISMADKLKQIAEALQEDASE